MRRLLLFSGLVLCCRFLLIGQDLTGSLTGTVLDSSGQALPGTQVRIVNTSTNLTQTAIAGANGQYLIPNLPIGTYSVDFSREGFDKESHGNILIQANRTATVNGDLKVGQVSTTVEVTGTPLLNQVDTAIGFVLDERTIRSTPLATGSFTQLAVLSPGINADVANGSGVNAGLGNEAIWANGQRDTSNSISINGANTNNLFNGKTGSQVASSRFTLNTGQQNVGSGDTRTNTSVYDAIGNSIATPPAETIAELRVNTSQYDASNSPNSGAHIEVLTRSGANDYHGELWEYFQNNILNAAPFFRNANTALPASQKVPTLHYNRFGASLGGPVKKDKLFFFVAYQGLRISDGLGGTSNVTVPITLTDDRSAAAISQLSSRYGTTVAASQISPVALKILQFKTKYGYLVPTPNITDPATAARLGYDATLQQPASTFQADQGIGNADYNINDRDRLAVRYMFQDDPSTSPFAQSSLLGFPQTLDSGSHVATVSNTTVLNPNLTWDQRIAFTRQRSYANTAQPLTPSDVGINLFGLTQFPSIGISNIEPTLAGKSVSFGPNSNFANAGIYQNRYSVASTVNWVLGRHTIYAGFNYDRTQLNVINQNNETAALSFNTFTDFLNGSNLNTASSRFFNGSSNRYYRADQVGTFIQDNYRLRSNLNINFGLRWDYDGPLAEKNGLLTNFYPGRYQYDALNDVILNSGAVIAGNNKMLGTAGVSDSTLTGRQWGLGPRFGVVYSPSSKLVIRSGFGIYYDRGEFFTELSPGAGRGFSGPFGVTLQLPFTSQINATSTGTLAQPFGSLPPAAPSDPAAITKLLPNAAALRKGAAPYLFSAYDPGNVLPYTENWSFDMQWQPLNSLVATLGYVGNRGLHALLPVPFNQPGIATPQNPIHGETSSYGFNVLPTENLQTNEGGNTDLRVPYIGYSSNALYYQARGNSTYHALQAGLQKRFSRGLQFSASYTFSHSLDDQSGLGLFFNGNDPTNPSSSHATSTYDRTHVFTISYLYELPALTNRNPVVRAFLGGWNLSGITVAQSGQPYNFYDFSGAVGGIYYGNTLSIVDPILGFTPGLTNGQVQLQGRTGVDPKNPVIDATKVFIPALPVTAPGVPPCVTSRGQPVCDTFETSFSSAGRNTFRGPFQTRFDFSIAKQFKLTERFNLKYSADFFNIFNHPIFDVPSNSTSLYSVTAGRAPTIRSTTNLGSLGYITSTIGSPRIIQMSLHLTF